MQLLIAASPELSQRQILGKSSVRKMNRFSLAVALALLCSAIAVRGGTQDECVAASLASASKYAKCSADATAKIQSSNTLSSCDSMKLTLPCNPKAECCSGEALTVFTNLYNALQCTGFQVTDYCGTYSAAAGLRASVFTVMVAAAASLCASRMF